MNNGVYITGAGIISAIGNNKDEVRQSLLCGVSGIREIRYLNTQHHELPCGEVQLSNEELRSMLNITGDAVYNRTALLGIEATRQAVKQAGISVQTDNVWMIAGTTVGGIDNTEKHFLDMLEHDEHLGLLSTHDTCSTTHLISGYFGIDAKNTIAISTACSSAANAIIVAANMIRTGKAEVVIAGGSESLSRFHINGFNTLMILDTERCRPFDNTRRGLNLGEGAAFVVLESAKSVIRRKATPLARLSGYGNRCDAFHQTASSDNGEGACMAMAEALATANLKSEDIDYINAHGTGTHNNDLSESSALKRVFAGTLPPVSSTKPFTGHTTSASGSIELVICLTAMLYNFIPANLGWKNQMPEGIIPSLGKKDVVLRHVMCNSFGFGGNDSSLIISRTDGTDNIPNSTNGASDIRTIEIETLAIASSTPDAPLDNLREFIPPKESRRLCPLLKSALMTSLTALRDAGITTPDAIVVATSYGMFGNSEKFLLQMCRDGEEGLSPTLFMQSTHNTAAGTLAIHTHCHGYNITYTNTDKDAALEQCLNDVKMQMQQGKINNALIGYHNEITPTLHDMLSRLNNHDNPAGVTSIAKVISKRQH